ncbi:MAG: ABC transporter permease [Thermoleophilia bacterium]|jgi:NitT/TauT family transport system permease protein
MASTTPRKERGEGTRAPATGGRPSKRSRVLFGVLGVVAMVVVWQVLAFVVSPAILASPADTAVALANMAWDGRLWLQLLITLKRLVIGLAIGAAFGFIIGVLSGLEPRLRSFLEPVRWVGMTIPAVIVAVLAMLWFGLGDMAVTFVVAVIVIPVVFVNTVAGVIAVDNRLVEMGRVYHFSWRLMLTQVYLPGIASPVMAGLTLAAGIAVRAVVLAEVLGAMDGIGYAFSRAMSYLEIPELFAWVIVLLALMAVLEFGILRPLKNRTMRWRKGGGE